MFESRINIDYNDGSKKRVGHLLNIKATTFIDKSNVERAAVLCYFIEEEGSIFKCLLPYEPYFYLKVEEHNFRSVYS